VLRHNLFEIRSAMDEGIDAVSRLSITLANADSRFSQIQRNTGWKGAKLTVRFAFFNLKQREQTSESPVVFRGVANPPDEITEAHVRLSFTSRMSLQRVLLPDVRIQRMCPWVFPERAEQREEAVSGGSRERYSPFFRCGYSADQSGGAGNLNGGSVYTSCDYTRASCIERGMFSEDSQGNPTRRFGGIEFVPASILVKPYGEKSSHQSDALDNEGKYNDFVPIVYGTAWYRPPIVFARNDGNLTRMEVLLGMGEIHSVLKVVVNGIELPAGSQAKNATATGWYNVASQGSRNGEFNLDFTNANGEPAGDPYGSMALLSVVVPNRINDGSKLPRLDVLLEGLRLATFDESGQFSGDQFTNNPAWVLLDMMRRSGWDLNEIDLASFGRTAAYCAERIETTDLNGNTHQVPRFACNVVLRRRRSAADIVRGIRNGAGLYLTYGQGGLLQLNAESSFAIQHPEKTAFSNSTEALNGGWPAFEFGDGASPFSDILRRENGEPTLRLWSRSTAETPNRYSVEFQDEFNGYQQDSLSLVDLQDAVVAGHEVNATLTALGIPNFSQAGRVIRLQLDKSIRGNTYVEFETGLRAIGLKPGDLITLSYAKEGFSRQPFRVVRIAPSLNYHTTSITAQLHDDTWYVGGGGTLGLIGGGRHPGTQIGVPRPLLGSILEADGETQFGIEESYKEGTDGAFEVSLQASFASPGKPSSSGPETPLLSLGPKIETTGGTLIGGVSHYYAVSGVGTDGSESPLSFVVRAAVPPGTETNTVTLEKLSFGAGTDRFHVYRGLNPSQMMRIAADQPLAGRFVDSGLDAVLAAPPDQNYDHANFFWRLELQPEFQAAIHSETTIGNDDLHMLENEWRGNLVRITEGKGKGQERIVLSNDATTLTLSKSWEVEPDSSSSFVVIEPAWTFGAMTQTSPVRIVVPNRKGTTVQVCGRSANVHDVECAYELSPVTRHSIGGAAADADVPDVPIFGLTSAGRGTVDITGVGFQDLDNTRSITAGTLMLHCWNELLGIPETRLAADIDSEATALVLNSAPDASPGTLLQVGSEVMVVQEATSEGYTVDRGAFGSTAVAHSVNEPVFALERKTFVLPFVRGFFGSAASGSYAHTLVLPNSRIVCGEFFVTNVRGNSQVSQACYSATTEGGIRTLSGGQFTFQVNGPLAVQSAAAPSVTIDAAYAVRDVFATVAEAPMGEDVLVRVTRNNESYCDLTIPAGEFVSGSVDGRLLQPLEADWKLGLDVISAGQSDTSFPGAGLTVTIRV
jgi:hypothetical protein